MQGRWDDDRMDPGPRVLGLHRSLLVSLRVLARLVALVCLVAVVASPAASQAQCRDGYLRAHRASIDFGKKHVDGEYFKRTRTTNVSHQPVRVLVYAGLPDDFSFGLMPGSTCPVLDGGAVMAPGAGCYAVVRFAPTEGFIGWHAVGEMFADSYDPVSGDLVEHLLIPVTGTAVR